MERKHKLANTISLYKKCSEMLPDTNSLCIARNESSCCLAYYDGRGWSMCLNCDYEMPFVPIYWMYVPELNTQDTAKFWEEDMIRNDMKKSEKLIRLLESREFQLEFNVGEKWFDDTIDLVKKECKAHLINCAERLVRSKNYR